MNAAAVALGRCRLHAICNGYDIMRCPICDEHVNYEIALDDGKAFCTCTICGTIVVMNLKLDDTPDYEPPY